MMHGQVFVWFHGKTNEVFILWNKYKMYLLRWGVGV